MTTVSELRITTSVKRDDSLNRKLKLITDDLERHYKDVEFKVISREKKTIRQLFLNSAIPLMVIQHERIYLYLNEGEKFFYHENTSRFKLKQLKSGQNIPELINLIGENRSSELIIDATTGLGNDLTLIASAYPNNKIYAFEMNFYIHFAVKWGMYFHFEEDELFHAIQNIHFVNDSLYEYDNLIEKAHVIYLDPMYDRTVTTSNISMIKDIAYDQPESVNQLINRIIKHGSCKLILCAHHSSELFQRYDFNRNIRPNTISHYGYIDL